MKFTTALLLTFWMVSSNAAFAQKAQFPSQKGNWYAAWGWNRDVFSKSNIRFTGDQYDFTLRNVVAHDKQDKFGLDPYFHPTKITIPQTDARIGYFLWPQVSLSVGLDHMKYVMEQRQWLQITGHIAGTRTSYDGDYYYDPIYTDRNFLKFEHTDGLNYVNTELRRHTPLLSLHKNKWLSLDVETFSGFGAGLLIPKTNVRMFGGDRYDEYHLAGWGAHVLTGLTLKFWRHFLVTTEFKGGYLDMPDIRTTKFKSERASQHFLFGELALMFGGYFRLWKE